MGRRRRSVNATNAASRSISIASMRSRTPGYASSARQKRKMKNSGGSQRLFWIVGGPVIALDILTKLLAVRYLPPHPLKILGDWLTLQLVFNPGAAFGIHVGTYSRWVFLVLAIVALIVLGSMVRHTKPGDHVRLIALGLVCGGAVGNLIDRI
ncbi:MAG: hypothetical protein E2O65_03600, partial [Gammaproteobacteria bacterium]